MPFGGSPWDYRRTVSRTEPRRLYRSTDDRILAGVCGGLAEHLSLDARAVRIAFAVLAFVGGTGLILYAAFWAVVPQRVGESDSARPRDRSHRRRPGRPDFIALCVLAGGIVLLVRQSGLWLGDAFVWPVLVAAVGVAIVWQQADESQRRRWAASARAPLTERPARLIAARLAGGVVLVAISVLWLLVSQDGFRAATRGLVAVLVAVAGLALLTGPWWWRLVRELSDERWARIRAQEKAELAAHLHDSVLQTLALIQGKANQPREVQRLARAQERELRSWLFARPQPDGTQTLSAAVEAAAAEVEDMHATSIDVVAVGDAPLDERLGAVVAAAKEAMVNAAKFAGVEQVQVFVEVEGDRVTVFVRDRGVGFDPSAVDKDRRGVSESIVGRMSRNGGAAIIRSSPGQGTEVELNMTRAAQ
ncbi:MAG: PspC domain-containing protein [Acidimicrobiia bacterium]|nr:PspC domain-containing protein [Acidimicrobiia bacterium]MBV9039629.1 PspC domain-containing protein [Acidimicrobiia bacterium]